MYHVDGYLSGPTDKPFEGTCRDLLRCCEASEAFLHPCIFERLRSVPLAINMTKR